MSFDLWLVRHGESEGNVAKVVQGHLPGKLTNRGHMQASKLSARLAPHSFEAVFVSDLTRALETFEPLQKAGWACEVRQDLREKSGGLMEGWPLGQAALEAQKAGVPERKFRAPGGESWEDLADRAEAFLHGLVQLVSRSGQHTSKASDSHGAKFLAISHGGFIKELLRVACVQGQGTAPKVARNTGVYVIRAMAPQNPTPADGEPGTCSLDGWSFKLVVENCVAHLKEPKAPAKPKRAFLRRSEGGLPSITGSGVRAVEMLRALKVSGSSSIDRS